MAAAETVYSVIATGVGDIAFTSPRRVFALASLAFQEAIRRRVLLVAFCVFALVLPLASWFLDRTSPDPARLYLSFVLGASSYLSLLLALFLSVFSLPNDMANKTIYTVVTKPVRATEIVLGRILGFTAIGTILLGLMGVFSYVFVTRGLDHSHEVDTATLSAVANVLPDDPNPVVTTGKTTRVNDHRHALFIRADGTGETDVANGHWHQVRTLRPFGMELAARSDGSLEVRGVKAESLARDAGVQEGDVIVSVEGKPVASEFYRAVWSAPRETVSLNIEREGKQQTLELRKEQYEVLEPQDMLTARVPVYGSLRYRDRTGSESNVAENVGNEWTYRQYIEGGTQAAAIWRFKGLTRELFPESHFPNGLRMQMTLSVFRTHKGTIDKPVLGDVRLRNPKKPSNETQRINFSSKEFAIYEHTVPWELPDSQGNKLSLFGDLIDDEGGLEVLISCVEPGQYFGAAQADLYFLARQASFEPNFIKGYIGIWLQMVLVIGIGVMFSTFLNGAVALLATLFSLVAGMFTRPIGELLEGKIEGGLMFESLYRILTHAPMTTDLEPGIGTNVIKGLDNIVGAFMRAMVSVVPDLPFFSNATYVSSGFDIPANNIVIHVLTALGYLVPLFIAGYFFLKTREVAK
jgi:hypothetical protein